MILQSSNIENTFHHFTTFFRTFTHHFAIETSTSNGISNHFHILYNNLPANVDIAESGLPVQDDNICCRFCDGIVHAFLAIVSAISTRFQ